jgi:hypothetical protein
MTDNLIRWTVRGIHPETLDMLANIQESSGGNYGEFINEAVAQWYDSLPDDIEEDDEAA